MSTLPRSWLAALLIGVAVIGEPALAQLKPPPDAAKSWIPERRSVDGGRAAAVDPPLSEAEKREQAAMAESVAADPDKVSESTAECIADGVAATLLATADGATPEAGRKVSPAFGAQFTQARDLIVERRYAEALSLTYAIDPHAVGRPEKLAVEQLRTSIHAALGARKDLIGSLERQIAIGGLPLPTIRSHCQTIEGLKTTLGLPPNDAGESDGDIK